MTLILIFVSFLFYCNSLDSYVVHGPKCIPLVSKNIKANPYHPALLSLPGWHIRNGFGLPSLTDINSGSDLPSTKCLGHSACTMKVAKSFTTSIKRGFSISLGNKESFEDKALTNSYTRSMSRTLDEGSKTEVEKDSVSDTISESLIESYEKLAGIFKTKSAVETNSWSIDEISYSQERFVLLTDSNSIDSHGLRLNMDKAEFDQLFPLDSTVKDFSDWFSVSNGKANSRIQAQSSISTDDNIESDSVSQIIDFLKTRSKSKSNENTNSNEYKVDETFQSSEENRISTRVRTANEKFDSVRNKSSNSTIYSYTYSIDESFELPAGSCKIAVCLPFVKAIPIPFECIRDETSKEDPLATFYADYIYDIEKTTNGIRCTNSIIDCSERWNPRFFKLDNFELENAEPTNTLYWGEVLNNPRYFISKNGMYILEIDPNGELTVKQGEQKIWSNNMGIFNTETKSTNNKKSELIRVRINEKGHLIEEVKGHLLFSNFNKNKYRKNEWVVVWSSAPIHHNVTIGIFKTPDNHKSYRMVLEESGNLMLYDAVGALIWCTASKCNHRFGYQFPEVY